MTGWSWLLYLVLVVVGAALSAWLYLRREPEGPGRLLLAGLRALTLAIILLIVLNPSLPSRTLEGGANTPRVLLDASASMGLPSRPGASATRWEAAVREARRRSNDVLLFGDQPRPTAAGSLPAVPPGDERSQVLPALRAAAEAGAERVVVITDGELEGTGSLPAWLARLGLGVEWIRVGEPLGGLAVSAVSGPAWAASGERVDLQVTLSAHAPWPRDSRLVVRQGDRTLLDTAFAPPAEGGSIGLTLGVLPVAPAGGGHVRLEVALQPGDDVAADDRRYLSLYLSPDPAGVALVSLQPDQEPRFLLPVLARALGVPVRGFLRAGPGWVRVGTGADAGARVPDAELRRALERAELVVLQGLGTEPPDWLQPLLQAGPPLLVLGGPTPPGLPVRLESASAGDWFLEPQVPASPVADLLADVTGADLPPLPALAAASLPPGAWAALLARRGRAGESRPLVIAGESAGRRWAVATAEGYWRWAFQGGDGRALYDRLWSAVGGWLMAAGGGDGAAIRPVARVVPRGQASRWVTAGMRADSVAVRFAPAVGGAALDTVLRNAAGDTLLAPVLPPGLYRYEAAAFGARGEVRGSGELMVETWSPELGRAPVSLSALAPADRVAAAEGGRSARRPLHTSPVPYILLVLLLSAEWVLRRRWGLR